jgi:hypothetical protein
MRKLNWSKTYKYSIEIPEDAESAQMFEHIHYLLCSRVSPKKIIQLHLNKNNKEGEKALISLVLFKRFNVPFKDME